MDIEEGQEATDEFMEIMTNLNLETDRNAFDKDFDLLTKAILERRECHYELDSIKQAYYIKLHLIDLLRKIVLADQRMLDKIFKHSTSLMSILVE